MNNINFVENEGVEGIQLLNQSIASFNGAAQKFETYYRHLENRVRELDIELANKNKELNRNLIEKEEVKNYLRNILESLTTGVIVVDLKGRITTFNRAAEYMTGMIFDEIKGKHIDKILGADLFPALNLEHGLLKDIKQKREIETEIFKDGKDVIHINLSSFPVVNPEGVKIGTALTFQDITQLKKLEENANRTDRLAAMGEMAAEIAHEIRNPLGSIELFATTLKKDLEDSGELKCLAEHISSGVRSLNNIISNLLLFIRPHQNPEFKIIDILTPLKDSLAFSYDLVETNERKIDVVVEMSSEPLLFYGDADLLKQVWLNLIMNAVQAMPDGGRLRISAKKLHCRETDSNFIEVLFMDTGQGVSGANISKIFNPFFTTKKKGTGLGLAIVHNILKIHGGDIDVESSEDKGTVCRVKMPLWKGQDSDY
jgi:PAS domain S-box-containing protein